ncbi:MULTISPECIES: hypothetical protein [unclassified Chitinophaga]|uniref:hypothetical protein n=1 Tax=unclassified Chitinophaga TaxID=2619133 RepID=UPI00300F7C93
MSIDPQKVVLDYLNKNGFPVEMKIAKELKKVGLGVTQSYFYQDPLTGQSREIDILGLYQKTIKDAMFNIIFIIECKYAKTPWILFTSNIGLGDSRKCYLTNKLGSHFLSEIANHEKLDDLFEVTKKYGFGLTVSIGETDDQKNNAYKSIQTLLNFLKSENKNDTLSYQKSYNLFVPIIVIKGKLFEAFLDDDDNLECNEISEGQIFYKDTISNFIPKIHIITDSQITSFAKKLSNDCNKIFESLAASFDEIVIKER